MQVPPFKVRTLMIVVALAGAVFASARCDSPALPQQFVWRGPEHADYRIFPGMVHSLQLDPQLAFWVIPGITTLVVQRPSPREALDTGDPRDESPASIRLAVLTVPFVHLGSSGGGR